MRKGEEVSFEVVLREVFLADVGVARAEGSFGGNATLPLFVSPSRYRKYTQAQLQLRFTKRETPRSRAASASRKLRHCSKPSSSLRFFLFSQRHHSTPPSIRSKELERPLWINPLLRPRRLRRASSCRDRRTTANAGSAPPKKSRRRVPERREQVSSFLVRSAR